jgi:hypothetical protein
MIMARNSMAKLTEEFPVPVTAFNQTVAIDINNKATETTLSTGIASCIKSSP